MGGLTYVSGHWRERGICIVYACHDVCIMDETCNAGNMMGDHTNMCDSTVREQVQKSVVYHKR